MYFDDALLEALSKAEPQTVSDFLAGLLLIKTTGRELNLPGSISLDFSQEATA